MSIVAAANAATTLAEAARTAIEKGRQINQGIRDATVTSLTSYTKATQILSRVYMDESIVNEPVTPGLIRVVMTTYLGLILTAMQMNQVVAGGKTVKEMMNVIATEGYVPYDDLTAAFEAYRPFDYLAAQGAKMRPWGEPDDAVVMAAPRDPITNMPTNSEPYGRDPITNQPRTSAPMEVPKHSPRESSGGPKSTVGYAGTSDNAGTIKEAEGGLVPVARMIELEFAAPGEGKPSVKLPVLVQLAPYIVPVPVVAQLISRDALPSVSQRWLQWRAGEISFWRDFIGQVDLAKRRAEAVKRDKSGVLADFAAVQVKKSGHAAAAALDEKAARSRNIANSVLVYSERAVKEAKAATGFDLHKSSDRARYFRETYSMIIAVVDPMYGRVTMYYNGIEDGATFTYDQFKGASKSSGGDAMDLVRAMTMLQQGQVPRF